MTTVKAKPGESFESLLRRFKKAVDRSGILSDFKKHEFYEKPSVKIKKKREAARKRAIKKLKKIARFSWKKTGGQNFRWNKDKTKKIPMVNRNNDNNRSNNQRGSFKSKPRITRK
jgi:small subunit ribosomal protein S21